MDQEMKVVHIPDDALRRVQTEAERLGRSMTWVVCRAVDEGLREVERLPTKVQQTNTHIKGTFAWARKEHKRGRKMTRAGRRDVFGDPIVFRFLCLNLEDIDATDWEVV